MKVYFSMISPFYLYNQWYIKEMLAEECTASKIFCTTFWGQYNFVVNDFSFEVKVVK